MPKNYCIMQIWAESGKSALPICNYSQILYQFLTFTQNLKRSRHFLIFTGDGYCDMLPAIAPIPWKMFCDPFRSLGDHEERTVGTFVYHIPGVFSPFICIGMKEIG